MLLLVEERSRIAVDVSRMAGYGVASTDGPLPTNADPRSSRRSSLSTHRGNPPNVRPLLRHPSKILTTLGHLCPTLQSHSPSPPHTSPSSPPPPSEPRPSVQEKPPTCPPTTSPSSPSPSITSSPSSPTASLSPAPTPATSTPTTTKTPKAPPTPSTSERNFPRANSRRSSAPKPATEITWRTCRCSSRPCWRDCSPMRGWARRIGSGCIGSWSGGWWVGCCIPWRISRRRRGLGRD